MCFLYSDIEHNTAILLDTIHQAEGRMPEFAIFENIRGCVKGRPLFLPLVCRYSISANFKLQKAAFELIEQVANARTLFEGNRKPPNPKTGLVLC